MTNNCNKLSKLIQSRVICELGAGIGTGYFFGKLSKKMNKKKDSTPQNPNKEAENSLLQYEAGEVHLSDEDIRRNLIILGGEEGLDERLRHAKIQREKRCEAIKTNMPTKKVVRSVAKTEEEKQHIEKSMTKAGLPPLSVDVNAKETTDFPSINDMIQNTENSINNPIMDHSEEYQFPLPVLPPTTQNKELPPLPVLNVATGTKRKEKPHKNTLISLKTQHFS